MPTRPRCAVPLAFALTFVCAAPAVAQNLVANPGFETGDLTGWTFDGSPSLNGVNTAFGVHGGAFGMVFGESGGAATLSQTLATVAGQRYTVAFWFQSFAPAFEDDAFFDAFFGDQQIFAVVRHPGDGYAEQRFVVTAAGAATALRFVARNDPTFYALDDVRVAAVVPEPATLALVGAGLLACGASSLTRRRPRPR